MRGAEKRAIESMSHSVCEQVPIPDERFCEFEPPRQEELAPAAPVALDRVRRPEYGRWLDELTPGSVFWHPRAFTVYASFAQEFATTFHEANPLHLSDAYAKAHGYRGLVAPPLLVLNLALGMGVQNDSEKAIAHLGYYDVRFLRPVHPGDTLRSVTTVVSRRERGATEPGIVHLRTACLNGDGEVVLAYDRKVLVPPRATPDAAAARRQAPAQASRPFPTVDGQSAFVPRPYGPYPLDQTGSATYFEDFRPGDIVCHANGRTVTQEHFAWTYRVGNTHPLHYDRVYAGAREGALSGEPVVYGGLVFAWVAGLASRDTSENALFDLGYTEGYHTQPVVAGDTLYAVSRVLAAADGPLGLDAGVVTLQLLGVKNVTAAQAIEKHGADLFLKEVDKKKAGKPKAAEKVFEIERRLLVKRRPRGL